MKSTKHHLNKQAVSFTKKFEHKFTVKNYFKARGELYIYFRMQCVIMTLASGELLPMTFLNSEKLETGIVICFSYI